MKKILIVLFLVLGMMSTPSYALITYWSQWDNFSLHVKKDRFVYFLQAQNRSNFNNKNLSDFLTRTSFGYEVSEKAILSLGVDYIQPYHNPRLRHYRTWEQGHYIFFSSSNTDLVSRTRFEQLYAVQFSDVALRLREMIMAKFKRINEGRLSFVVYDEVFLNLKKTIWISQKTFSQNRIFLGLGVSISDKTEFLIGYLNRMNFIDHHEFLRTSTSKDETIMEHIPYISFDIKFD